MQFSFLGLFDLHLFVVGRGLVIADTAHVIHGLRLGCIVHFESLLTFFVLFYCVAEYEVCDDEV